MTFPASLAQTLNEFQLHAYPSVTGLSRPVTARSILYFAGALLWTWCLLLSFIGWGRIAGRLLRVLQLPSSIACSLGIAVVIFIAGILNLLHAMYADVLFAIVAAGMIFYLGLYNNRPQHYRWRKFWNQSSTLPRLLIIAALLLLCLRVAATVHLASYNTVDDGPAYLAFPQKMLAAHHFAFDPFSDRRLISSLGGAYFLQDLVIIATSLSHIAMADRALGLVMLFLVLYDLGICFELPALQIAGIELIVFLIPQETNNLSFIILPIPLFIAMAWLIFASAEQEKNQRWRYAVMVGTIGGGIICLKSIFLPYTGALILISFSVLFWQNKRSELWKLPVYAGAACLAVIGAWMIAMKQDSGTLLFPILGHGVDYSSYHLFQSAPRFSGSHIFVRVTLQGIILLVLAAIQFLGGIRERKSQLSFAILIAAAIAITAFNLESGGDYVWRYNFSQFFSAILIFAAAGAGKLNRRSISRRAEITAWIAVLSLVGCIFYYDLEGGSFHPFREMKLEASLYRCSLRASISGISLASPAVLAEYSAIEAAIPFGATALENTARPFLFNNHRSQTIYIDDWAGAASPPPGWPFGQQWQQLTQFLFHNGIRYIIYDYDYGEWDDMRSCQSLTGTGHNSQLDRNLQVLGFLAHHQFDRLRATHKSIYDDGKIDVIDLDSPILSNHPPQPEWSLDTSEAEMCSQIASKYIVKNAPTTHHENSSCK